MSFTGVLDIPWLEVINCLHYHSPRQCLSSSSLSPSILFPSILRSWLAFEQMWLSGHLALAKIWPAASKEEKLDWRSPWLGWAFGMSRRSSTAIYIEENARFWGHSHSSFGTNRQLFSILLIHSCGCKSISLLRISSSIIMRFTSSVLGALAFAGAASAKEMAVNEELARSESLLQFGKLCWCSFSLLRLWDRSREDYER